MKKLLSIALALVLLTSIVGAAAAQGTRVTAFQIVNLGSSPADITIDYYNAMDGSATAGQLKCSDTVVGLGSFKSVQYNQGGDGTCISDEVSWQGSVVIGSTEPIAVITNINETVPPNVYYAGGSYGGIPDAHTAPTLVLPFIMYNYAKFNTDFAIQNAGSGDATVYLDFYRTGSSTIAKTEGPFTIKPGASYYRNQKTDDANLGDGWSGVVVVRSNQPVAAVVNETAVPELLNTSMIMNYEGFAQGDSTIYMPFLAKNYAGFSTAFQVVAMEAGTTGTISFFQAGSSTASATLDLNLNQYEALEWNMKTMDGYTTGSIGDNWSGAGVIQLTGGSAVTIVNQRGTNAQGYKLGMTYSGIPGQNSAQNLTFPFVIKKYASKQWNTAFQVVNVGAAGTVTVYYDALEGSGFSSYSWTSPSLGTNQPLECNQLSGTCIASPLPDGWVGSVRIEGAEGTLVAGICNQRSPNVPNDNGLVYNGFSY